jgi:hypothetical protein
MENVIHLNSVGSALVYPSLKVYPVEANGHVVFDPCLATPLESIEAEWVAALDDHDWSLIAEAAGMTDAEVACAKELAADNEYEPFANGLVELSGEDW